MVSHPMPLQLASKLAFLDQCQEWQSLLEYLQYRERQLHNMLFSGTSERDPDELVAKMTMVARGGEMELALLRGLPELCKEICKDEAKRAEALNRK